MRVKIVPWAAAPSAGAGQRDVKWAEVRQYLLIPPQELNVMLGPSWHRVFAGCHKPSDSSLRPNFSCASRRQPAHRLHLPPTLPAPTRSRSAMGRPLLPPYRVCQCHEALEASPKWQRQLCAVRLG